MLTTDTFCRPVDMTDSSDPAVLYVLSYLHIRTVVGFLGILTPLILLVGDAFFLEGDLLVRGSLSAYYHTPMKDVFVAILSVTGFLLVTYMSGQGKTWDFWLSLVAGVAVLGVVFFPTHRPGLAPGDPRCGALPVPEGCSPVQQRLGEEVTAVVHHVFAAIFILSLAAIAFLFAHRARQYDRNRVMALVQDVCGWLIIAAVIFVVVGELAGVTVAGLAPLYLGEVVAVWSFGVSWLLKGVNLRDALRRRRRPRDTADPGVRREEEVVV